METINKTTEKALMILLKEPFAKHTATSLAKALNITRQGLWKSLNKLTENKLIVLEPAGSSTKSIVHISPQWKNPVAIKTLSLLLTKEAINHQRWLTNFSELEDTVDFLIIYGSIIYSSKEANDIDIIIVADKKNFKEIDKILSKVQKTQLKKIHTIIFTQEEFKHEIKNQNKAFIDAIKKGVILFGQDDFIKFIKEIK